MSFASYRFSTLPDRLPLRRQTIALILTIIVHLLLLLVLLNLAPTVDRRAEKERNPVTFELMPQPQKARGPTAKKQKKQADSGAAPQRPTPPVPPKTPTETPPVELPFLKMSREDFAATDVARMPSQRSGAGAGSAGAGKDSSATVGPGEGPGGVQLFDAEWYRKPTNAQLSTYMPADAPRTGWGLVACKTVEDYHVENCQSLGESPLGSGFARAVRQAAWQFLVRPPRIDGKPQVGAWVRIRIDYVQGVAQ